VKFRCVISHVIQGYHAAGVLAHHVHINLGWFIDTVAVTNLMPCIAALSHFNNKMPEVLLMYAECEKCRIRHQFSRMTLTLKVTAVKTGCLRSTMTHIGVKWATLLGQTPMNTYRYDLAWSVTIMQSCIGWRTSTVGRVAFAEQAGTFAIHIQNSSSVQTRSGCVHGPYCLNVRSESWQIIYIGLYGICETAPNMKTDLIWLVRKFCFGAASPLVYMWNPRYSTRGNASMRK